MNAAKYSKDPQTDKSLRHSLKDAVAFSVMSGGLETYFSAFALFLKATASQVAFLATFPNLIGSLAQLLSAWLGHRLNQRKPLIVIGAYSQAAILPLMILLPWFYRDYAIAILVVCLTLYYAASHFIAPQWMSLMGELVSERRRGRFFARRTALATITSFSALCIAGLILHVFNLFSITIAGFALLFGFAFIARLTSAWHLAQMHEPNAHAASLEPVYNLHWLKGEQYRPALRFSLFFVLMQSAVGISAPFFSVYMLKTLQFSYLEYMANIGTAVLVQFLTLSYWGRISDVMGNRLVLLTTGSIIPFLPAMWVWTGNFWYLMCIQIISGFCWAGFSLSAGNIMYELIPREKRATYQALQSVVMTLGVFCGSMLGVAVTNWLPAQWSIAGVHIHLAASLLWALLLSSCCRILVALIFLPRVQELRKPRRKISPYQLVFRFTRFNAFSGLLYDIVTKVQKQDRER
jgi:MFS family permease